MVDALRIMKILLVALPLLATAAAGCLMVDAMKIVKIALVALPVLATTAAGWKILKILMKMLETMENISWQMKEHGKGVHALVKHCTAEGVFLSHQPQAHVLGETL